MEDFLINYLSEYSFITLLVSFAIGIVSSLSPCSVVTLPFLISSSITLSNAKDVKNKKLFIYKYAFVFFVGMIISYSIMLFLFSKFAISLSSLSGWFVYLIVGILTLLIVLYSLKTFSTFDTSNIINKLLPYKFYGAFIIGVLHGFISSPCGTAPFIAMLTLASQSTWISSYLLVFTFAIGQGLILLLAALFIGLFQSITNNSLVVSINKVINSLFIIVLFFIGIYFMYKAYLTFSL